MLEGGEGGLPLRQLPHTLGRKVLKPSTSSLWPLKSSLTRWMTPAVSILRTKHAPGYQPNLSCVRLACPRPGKTFDMLLA